MAFSIHVVTLFPELFEPFARLGLVGQAIQQKNIDLNLYDLRKWSTNTYHSVDDRPYGGGDGMVMMAEPLAQALKSVRETLNAPLKVVYLSPQGQKLDDRLARDLADERGLVLLCGRYGGIDERFMSQVDLEISIGDYVLNGGEVAAMAVVEACSRFVPGVLGNRASADIDSFSNGWLEAPQYTRPPVWEGVSVPDVLLSGDHKRIHEWRRLVGLLRTAFRRPDLLKKNPPSPQDKTLAAKLFEGLSASERKQMGLPEAGLPFEL